MTDEEIANAWVLYYQTGSESLEWAVSELDELSKRDPCHTWTVIQLINSTKIVDENWRTFIDGVLGCGPLETIIAMFPEKILERILLEAKQDERLSRQLGVIYESSLPKETWNKIQLVLNHNKI